MLAMILRDLDRFQEKELSFLFSAPFIERLNRSDPAALCVLKGVTDERLVLAPLSEFIQEISAYIAPQEAEPDVGDHLTRIIRHRSLLEFQLARSAARLELRRRREDIASFQQSAPNGSGRH